MSRPANTGSIPQRQVGASREGLARVALYNRAQDTVDFQGKKVFKGGESSIVVSSIEQSTGELVDDGKLTFVRKYDIDVSGKTMFWMGMVQL